VHAPRVAEAARPVSGSPADAEQRRERTRRGHLSARPAPSAFHAVQRFRRVHSEGVAITHRRSVQDLRSTPRRRSSRSATTPRSLWRFVFAGLAFVFTLALLLRV